MKISVTETKRFFTITLNGQTYTQRKNTKEWVDGTPAKDVIETLESYLRMKAEERAERNAKVAANREEELQAINDLIESGQPIEATLDKIRLVLIHLHGQNWGSWALPKMTINYSAHQYDCDGKPATTITLDAPVDGSTKFKIGGKHGHLNQYRSI